MPANLSDETRQQIDDALLAGNKIAAIKIYRDATGEGLKEAKDAVEAIESELRAKWPGKFELRARGGCLGVLLLAISVAVVGWMVLR